MPSKSTPPTVRVPERGRLHEAIESPSKLQPIRLPSARLENGAGSMRPSSPDRISIPQRPSRSAPAVAQPDGTVSIPEKTGRFGRTPSLNRFDRTVVPPNQGATPAGAIGTVGTGGMSTTVAASSFATPAAAVGAHVHHHGSSGSCNVDCWFSNPCNRFVLGWHSGCQWGYVFCGSSFYWYSWWPGCAPYYSPYCYYWRPWSYYYPAYYPSYATAYVVHDTYDVPAYEEPVEPSTETPKYSRDEAPAFTSTGWEHFRGGDYFDAVESFRQAVLADPDDAQAKIAFAQGLFALGQYADAAFLIRRASELSPDLPVVGVDPRGRYADPMDHAEQMVALRAFLERVPGDPAALLVLAVQSYFTGDVTAARESFQLLHGLDPEDQVAKQFLERLGPAPAPAARPGAAPADDRR
jgi:hypothetical protein